MRGPWINCSAVLIGGYLGATLGKHIPERIREALPLTLGFCSVGLGIAYTIQVKHWAPVILSLLLGCLVGELMYLEKMIEGLGKRLRAIMERYLPQSPDIGGSEAAYLNKFVAVLVIFCASGTGIFGALKEGMSGDVTILVAKSILDFCAAVIFATELGFAVTAIAIPQLIFQTSLLLCAGFVLPLITPGLMADFSAVGGVIMLATGLRICDIRKFPVATLLPSMLFAVPLSAIWTHFFST